VEHLRGGNEALTARLQDDQVLCHPFVVGELACGHLRNRREILHLLHTLPQAPLAREEEVLTFVEVHRLAGIGLGWSDVHLLAAARLAHATVWTLDRRMADAAQRLRLS
jgi:predicted nucleic acid-binding protein